MPKVLEEVQLPGLLVDVPEATALGRAQRELGALTRAPQIHLAAPFDIRRLIEGEHVLPHFQVLVSLKRGAVVGVEGWSRGWLSETQSVIDAPRLFAEAQARPLDCVPKNRHIGAHATCRTLPRFGQTRLARAGVESSVGRRSRGCSEDE